MSQFAQPSGGPNVPPAGKAQATNRHLERRAQYRVDADGLRAQVCVGPRRLEALALDASAGGVSVAIDRGSHQALVRRQPVIVVLTSPELEKSIALPCTVVRRRPGPNDTMWYALGFDEDDPLNRVGSHGLRQLLNRRVSHRVRPRRPVEAEITTAPTDLFWRSFSTGLLLDVSVVGVGLLVPRTIRSRYDDSKTLAVRFELPGGSETTEIKGDLIYQDAYGPGVRFGLRIDYRSTRGALQIRNHLRDYVMRRLYEDAWQKKALRNAPGGQV